MEALSKEYIAERAEALLKDQVLNLVLDEMETEAVFSWKRSHSLKEREEAHAQTLAVEALRQRLQAKVENLKFDAVMTAPERQERLRRVI
jgi:hypothetical protein